MSDAEEIQREARMLQRLTYAVAIAFALILIISGGVAYSVSGVVRQADKGEQAKVRQVATCPVIKKIIAANLRTGVITQRDYDLLYGPEAPSSC